MYEISERDYSDLKNLVFKGFIPLKTKINKNVIVFKTLNEVEYDLLKLLSDESNNFINFFYLSIWMIDGENILPCREKYYKKIYNIVKQFPIVLLNKFLKDLESLVIRMNECVDLMIPYSYEIDSRYQWACRKYIPINDEKSTGIKGTGGLSINYYQKYWVYLNIKEDESEQYKQNYSLTKFQGSFWNPKAAKSIDNQDKAQEASEKERRERIRTGLDKYNNIISKSVDTREELIDELERQMRGEKDLHDQTIEKYERDMKMDIINQMKEMEKFKSNVSKNNLDIEQARPISKEEIEEKLKRARARQEIISKPQHLALIDKYSQMSSVKLKDFYEKGVITEEMYNSLVEAEKNLDD